MDQLAQYKERWKYETSKESVRGFHDGLNAWIGGDWTWSGEWRAGPLGGPALCHDCTDHEDWYRLVVVMNLSSMVIIDTDEDTFFLLNFSIESETILIARITK